MDIKLRLNVDQCMGNYSIGRSQDLSKAEAPYRRIYRSQPDISCEILTDPSGDFPSTHHGFFVSQSTQWKLHSVKACDCAGDLLFRKQSYSILIQYRASCYAMPCHVALASIWVDRYRPRIFARYGGGSMRIGNRTVITVPPDAHVQVTFCWELMLFCIPGLPHAAAGSRLAVHMRDIHHRHRHTVDHDHFVSSSWGTRRSELLLVSPEHCKDSLQFSAITGSGSGLVA
jgi:hypothetical protein